MASPLLYPTLRDAKYVNQFVGSTFPELKEMRQALIERWDAAKETDSKAKALALDVLQNAHPSNLETAKKIYEASQEKFKKREETGNYEDLLPQTLDDARMLGVNVAKLSKNKQLIEDFQKKVTADPDINAKRKKEYFENVFTPNVNANTLDFDKETGVVSGNYFVEPPIQKDFDVAGNLDKFFTGMKSNANKTAIGTYRSGVIGNDGKLRPSKPGEQEYVFKETTSGGWEQITLDEVGYIAQNYLKGNSDFNAYDAARRVEKVNLKLIEIDKSNLPPDEKEKRKKVILDAAGKEFEDEEVTPTIEAIKSKYAYEQTSNAYDIGFDVGANKYLGAEVLKSMPKELPQVAPLGVAANTAFSRPELTMGDINQAKNGKDFEKFLAEKDPENKMSVTDRDDLRNIYRVLAKKDIPLEQKITSLTSKDPLLKSLVQEIKNNKIQLTENNLLTAYNSARKLLLHTHALGEINNEDITTADYNLLFGDPSKASIPEVTQAATFKNITTGKEYSFRDIPLPSNVIDEGLFGIGRNVTIGDALDDSPEKVKELKSVIANPVRILPFGNKGGYSITMGGDTYITNNAVSKEQQKENAAVYTLNTAFYGENGASKIINPKNTFLETLDEFKNVNKIQSQRKPLIDANGNFQGFKVYIYSINDKNQRSRYPLTDLDEINNYFRKHGRSKVDVTHQKIIDESGAYVNHPKEEQENEE